MIKKQVDWVVLNVLLEVLGAFVEGQAAVWSSAVETLTHLFVVHQSEKSLGHGMRQARIFLTVHLTTEQKRG
jgi:hypothetical protein